MNCYQQSASGRSSRPRLDDRFPSQAAPGHCPRPAACLVLSAPI